MRETVKEAAAERKCHIGTVARMYLPVQKVYIAKQCKQNAFVRQHPYASFCHSPFHYRKSLRAFIEKL